MAEESEQLAADSRAGCLSARSIMALMSFLGFVNVYAMRVNLSVAIVAMINSTAVGNHSVVVLNDTCPAPFNNGTSDDTTDGPFNWDEKEQGWILAAFFYGYVLTQLPGGRLAELWGGKWLYGCGVLVTAVFTLLTPVAASYSVYLFIIVRVIEGLGEGVTFPAMHAMLAKWSPPGERSAMASRIYSGAEFGTVVSMPISGLLCDHYGWQSVFYVFGSVGVVWFVLWCLLVYDTPAKHPRISPEEREYIETSLGTAGLPGKPPPVPWKSIATSVPFWSLAIVHVAQNYGFYTLLTELPTYMKNILHFNIKQDAFLSALPYLVKWVLSNTSGLLADWLIARGLLSVTAARKVFNSLGIYLPALALIVVSYSGCDVGLTIAFLALAVGLNGLVSPGFTPNHLDLAPNFAGTLLGITNCFSNVSGFLAPIIVGHIISGEEDLYHWRVVFFIASIVYLVGNTVFVLFGSGKEQPWNRIQADSDSNVVEVGAPDDTNDDRPLIADDVDN